MSERRSFTVDVEADIHQVVNALKDAGIPVHQVQGDLAFGAGVLDPEKVARWLAEARKRVFN